MAGNLTDGAENRILDHLFGTAAWTPTGPIRVALLTALGSDSAAGTEVTGGSYARQTVTVGAASGGAVSNTGTVSFTGMPACTVVGVDVYDSSATPVRIWSGPLSASKTVSAGDTFQFAAGQLTFSLD